jgi:transposase
MDRWTDGQMDRWTDGQMERKRYASDISREKFAEVEPVLRSVRRCTKPATVDLYEVFCGVLYVLRTGCQWRFLPSEFTKWQTVYAYFAKRNEPHEPGFSAQTARLMQAFLVAENFCSKWNKKSATQKPLPRPCNISRACFSAQAARLMQAFLVGEKFCSKWNKKSATQKPLPLCT